MILSGPVVHTARRKESLQSLTGPSQSAEVGATQRAAPTVSVTTSESQFSQPS